MKGGHTPLLFYSRRPPCKTLWSDLASSHAASVSRHDRHTGLDWHGAVICVSSIRYVHEKWVLTFCSVHCITHGKMVDLSG